MSIVVGHLLAGEGTIAHHALAHQRKTVREIGARLRVVGHEAAQLRRVDTQAIDGLYDSIFQTLIP